MGLFSRRKRSERDIFTFWDGKEERSLDPLPIWRALWGHPLDLETEMKFAWGEKVDQKTKDESFGKVLDIVRDVFELKRFEEGGLTERETNDVLVSYFSFMEDLKKKQG